MGFLELPNRFRLIDVEGVLISAGSALEIREPQDFQEIEITLRRDEETHGVFFEFTEEETPFGFVRNKIEGETYSAYDLIKAIRDEKGADGQCLFQIQSYESASWVTNYEGELDFSMCDRQDYVIYVHTRRVLLGDKFRSRKDIPVSFSATESLDGDSITGLSHVSMFLHSKVLNQVQRTNIKNLETEGDLDSTEDYFIQLFYQNEIGVTNFLETLQEEYGNDIVTGVFKSVDSMTANYVFIQKKGVLKFDISADYNIITEALDGETITLNGLFAEVDGVELEIGSVSDSFSVVNPIESFNVTYTVDATINIPIGASVKIYEKWNFPDTGSASSINLTTNNDYLAELTFQDIADNSDANVYLAKSTVNHIIEMITGETNVVVSDFLDNNGTTIYLSSGYLIRNFSVSDRTLKFSLNDVYSEFLNPVFGLGMSLLNDSGFTKCAIERFSYFYQDAEIIEITNIVDGSFKESYDNDVHFNKIDTGYSIFPSSTDENKFNNIDEFNTKHVHLTPLERVKGTYSKTCTSISSGYKIENQRREQFKKKSTSTVSNDDNLFVLMGVESDTYTVVSIDGDPTNVIFDSVANTISLYGSYFDIEVENITISGAGMLNSGTYSISSVSVDGAYTVLSTPVSSDESFNGDYTITISTDRLRAARDDEFDTVSNVIDRKTIYNGGINPKYMLLNHSPVYLSGLVKKSATNLIKTQDAKLNEGANFEFKSGQGSYVLGSGQQVVMDGNLQLSEINSNTSLFSGLKYTFDARISFSQFNTIKDSLTDINDANLHGYISFSDPDGNSIQAFPTSITYNIVEGMASFELRGKFVQTEFEYLLLESGDFLLLETGDKLILE